MSWKESRPEHVRLAMLEVRRPACDFLEECAHTASDLNLSCTYFELLGSDENDITYSVGWALARSRSFLSQFVRETTGYGGNVREAVIRLQHYREQAGITDIEVELPGQFHLIAEAKRGWSLPSARQLSKYAPRLRNSGANGRIVVLSECSPEYARYQLGLRAVARIPVEVVSWKAVAKMANRAIPRGKHAEKRLLRELLSYMGRVTTVQDMQSNWAYVVALGSGTKRGWAISWIDMVEKRRRYFHRMGANGWPKEPPNYIAFRYRGRLQSVHHIESYRVVTDLHEAFREIPSKKHEPFFVYELGPPIVPSRKVPTGKIWANGRVWCMLDTLFTCETIAHARDLSKKRSKAAK